MASLITLDPVASALEAIRAHFVAGLPSARTIRGPQEFPEDFDGDGVVLSLVEIGPREYTHLSPTAVDRTSDGPVTETVLYKVAQIQLRAQLDIWTPYRFVQDVTGPVVEALFHNRLPWKTGLELASTQYHDRPLTVFNAGAALTQQSPDDVAEGIFHRIWDIEIVSDLVVELTSQPTIAEIQFILSTELGPDTVTESGYTVPAS